MSTRAHITVLGADGKFRTVYHHSDGYPSYLHHILMKKFNSQEYADWIVFHGDASILCSPIGIQKWPGEEAPGYETEETEDPQASRFYCNRAGENAELIKAKKTDTIEDAVKLADEDYHYIWNGEEWFCNLGVCDGEKSETIQQEVRNVNGRTCDAAYYDELNKRAERMRGEQTGTPDSACCCNAAVDAEQASITIEMIEEAYDHLRDMVNQCQFPVMLHMLIDKGRYVNQKNSTCDAVTKMSGRDAVKWIAACGYLMRAGSCFCGNPKTVSQGVKLAFKEDKSRINPIGSLFRIAGCDREECEED